MPAFDGRFQYSGPGTSQEGPCRVQFDAQTFTLTPQHGVPIAFDLGDLDAVVKGDWELRLPLYTGRAILLRQFGKAFEDLCRDLLEAYRKRAIQCLLLEDLEEIERFTGTFELTAAGRASRSGPAEFRLYKSNLAVLPTAEQAFQWRLADLDTVRFDPANYEVVLECGPDRLKATRLAKRTEEFASRVRDAMAHTATRSAQSLHAVFPFLSPDQLQATVSLMKEGRAVPVSKLEAIHPKTAAALTSNAVDKDLKPYYEHLLSRTATGMLYAGFKLIRPEDKGGADTSSETGGGSESSSDAEDIVGAPDADPDVPQALYWFFFPIAASPGAKQAANLVAWEASSSSGRATYFFRLTDPAQPAQLQDLAWVETAIRHLNRVLGMLNFRRRPLYLSEDELAMNPQFHRYAIAARRIPELRQVRANLLGRAMHSSVDEWQTQVASILGKAGL